MSQYIAKWKDGFEVVWRNLTWKEYREFKQRYDQSKFEEPMDVALDVYRTVYIDGPDYKFVPAGIPGYICRQQMSNNPFSGTYEDLSSAIKMARNVVASNYLLSAKGIIAATLNYKPEEIDNWDPNTFFLRLAQTEIASGMTFDPVNPKAPKSTNESIPKKNLSSAQQKAVDRTRERNRGN